MSRLGPCLCGDTWCPSCGPLQGNWEAEPDPVDIPRICDACGVALPEDYTDLLCAECNNDLLEIKRGKEWKYPYARED